jgi:hypothetical protein
MKIAVKLSIWHLATVPAKFARDLLLDFALESLSLYRV